MVRVKCVSCTYINLPHQGAVTFHTRFAFFSGLRFFRVALGRWKGGRKQALKVLICLETRNIEMVPLDDNNEKSP